MSEEDIKFLTGCKYFWTNKEDIERYIGYNRERLMRLDPQLLLAWENYKLAIITLNSLT